MEINKNDIYAALNRNPEQLTALARQIAAALGFPEEKANMLVQNRDLIAAKLSRMSDADIANLISTVGEDNARLIIDKIKENGNG